MSLEENNFFLPKGKLKANKIMIFFIIFVLLKKCLKQQQMN